MGSAGAGAEAELPAMAVPLRRILQSRKLFRMVSDAWKGVNATTTRLLHRASYSMVIKSDGNVR